MRFFPLTPVARLANVEIMEKQITQKMAAEALGVTEQYYSQMITGKTRPKPARAERLAKIMGVTPWYLTVNTARAAREYMDRLSKQ
jgi:transcriptional regulator with XRE-family HTH domain